MARSPTVCPQPGCPNLTPCAAHTRPAWRDAKQRRPKATQVSARQRARILRRDPICRRCHTNPSTEADHVVAVALGGPARARDADLQGLCSPCHRAKTQAEAAQARWGGG